MSETALDQWRRDSQGLTFGEYLDQCPHWDAPLTLLNPPEAARLSDMLTGSAQVKGSCPRCGKSFHVLFGEWIEFRKRHCKVDQWRHCILHGGLKEQMSARPGQPYECDCAYCRELKRDDWDSF